MNFSLCRGFWSLAACVVGQIDPRVSNNIDGWCFTGMGMCNFGAEMIAQRMGNSPAPSTLLLEADPKVSSSRTFNQTLG